MSTDTQESSESHPSSSNVFSNFYKEILSVIRTAVNQHHADYSDQVKALSDRVSQLEESQEKWVASTSKLLEEYQDGILRKSDARIEAFTVTIQSFQSAVQRLETQVGQTQKTKAELTACIEELRGDIKEYFKITDQLVSDMNQLEVKQEELDKKLSIITSNLQDKKRHVFSWFSR